MSGIETGNGQDQSGPERSRLAKLRVFNRIVLMTLAVGSGLGSCGGMILSAAYPVRATAIPESRVMGVSCNSGETTIVIAHDTTWMGLDDRVDPPDHVPTGEFTLWGHKVFPDALIPHMQAMNHTNNPNIADGTRLVIPQTHACHDVFK